MHVYILDNLLIKTDTLQYNILNCVRHSFRISVLPKEIVENI